MKKGTLRTVLAALLYSVLGLTGIAQADVTIMRTTAVEGLAGTSLGNMNGSTTTVISGDKSRTDTDVKLQSKLVGFLARGSVGPTAEIISIDQDQILHLNINKKEYTQTTFEQLHAQLQKATDQMNQTQESKQGSAIDQSKCEWLPAKVSVNKTGEKAQFAGYDSERVVITASQPCQDKESGSICEVALILDQWLSPDFSEGPEVRKFYTAYAAKMGLDAASLQDQAQKAKAMFSQYKDIWTQVAAKMQGVKGYPVRTGFTLALGGAQCKDPKARQSQSNPSGDSSNSPGGLAGAMAGKLGGLFHKKSSDDASAPASVPTPAVSPVPLPAGDVALMTVSSQLVSVSSASVSPDTFVVPADYKKQEIKSQ